MTPQKTICIYCGASPRVDDRYKKTAHMVGKMIAEAGYRVVYGGGHSGLMGIIADAALSHGGEVIGIIPDHIDEREIRHTKLTELHVVNSMHERKAMMERLADAFLILPGGMGTMDEFFEIVTWRQLRLHNKDILVYNAHGYWENLRLLLEKICAENFMAESDTQHYFFSDSFTDIMERLGNTSATTASICQDTI